MWRKSCTHLTRVSGVRGGFTFLVQGLLRKEENQISGFRRQELNLRTMAAVYGFPLRQTMGKKEIKDPVEFYD